MALPIVAASSSRPSPHSGVDAIWSRAPLPRRNLGAAKCLKYLALFMACPFFWLIKPFRQGASWNKVCVIIAFKDHIPGKRGAANADWMDRACGGDRGYLRNVGLHNAGVGDGPDFRRPWRPDRTLPGKLRRAAILRRACGDRWQLSIGLHTADRPYSPQPDMRDQPRPARFPCRLDA